MQKKVVILQHNGGRLANQLWLYISVYAYCLEKGYQCENQTFFEYSSLFTIPRNIFSVSFLFKILSDSLGGLSIIIPPRFSRQFLLTLYNIYVSIIIFLHKKDILYDTTTKPPYYLPPTVASQSFLKQFEKNKKVTLYTSGWLFRNPTGIKKHYKKIKNYFKPTPTVWISTIARIHKFKKKYSHIVGVHIRQGDYKSRGWRDKYLEPVEVKKILLAYLKNFKKKPETTCFVVCSDEKIDLSLFKELHIIINNGSAIEDLFTLSLTDIILGSDSTFGAFASYYGNIPYIVLNKKGIDWAYYKDKKKYFENRFNTTVLY